jgi:hypothetical protein
MKFEKIDQREVLSAILAEVLRLRAEHASLRAELTALRAQIADPVVVAIRAYVGRGEGFTCAEILAKAGAERREASAMGQMPQALASALGAAGIADARALAQHLKSHGATALKATKTGRVWAV